MAAMFSTVGLKRQCPNRFVYPSPLLIRLSQSYRQVRWSTTMVNRSDGRAKSAVYRLSGFKGNMLVKDISKFIEQHMSKSERYIRPDISIVPACYSTSASSQIALVKFQRHEIPQFLAPLTQQPMEEIVIEYDGKGDAQDTITIDRHFHGFTQLYPTNHQRAISADIIAITGMDGHAFGSWASRDSGAMWLRDFLSQDLQDCRTMIYGYHSKLLATNINQLKEYGRLFLAEIEKVRNTAELRKRPIIFICHSYGGIVLSHCLVHAKLSIQPEMNSLYKSTYGMMFFGTPHRGSPKDGVLKMVEEAYPNRIPALLQTESASKELSNQLQMFTEIIGDRKIASFYETQPTPIPTPVQGVSGKWERAGSPVLQVDERSAVLQFPGYREVKIPVNANHTDMVKFSSRINQTYTTVLKILREFVRDAPRAISQQYAYSFDVVKSRNTVPFQRERGFIGRADILARLDSILAMAEFNRRAAVIGLSGIGKSAIAIHYATLYRKTHPEASTFFVGASSAATFSQSFREIAEVLKLEGRDEPKADVLRIVSEYLSEERHGNWLMILDNADDRSLFSMNHGRQDDTGSYQPLLSFLPQGTHGCFIVTSRDRNIARDFTGDTSSIIHVHPLDDLNSVKLLQERSTDYQSKRENAIELVNILDNIPLAVTHAAAFIYNGAPRTSIKSYLSWCKKNMKKRQPETTIPKSVFFTGQISFDKISHDHPKSFKLLSLMSFFHNDDIPDFLFTENTVKYENDKNRFEKDIGPLLRFSLIMPDRDPYFDVHISVQIAVRIWLNDHQLLNQRFQEALSMICNSFPDISAGFENWAKCSALLPHAEAILALPSGRQDLLQPQRQGKLFYNMAYYEYVKGDHAAALKHSMNAKKIQSDILDHDDQQLIQTRTLIFRLLSELGQGEKAINDVQNELSRLHLGNPGFEVTDEYLVLLGEKARINLDLAYLKEGTQEMVRLRYLRTAETESRNVLRLMMAHGSASEVHKLDAKRTLARAISFQGEPEQTEDLFRQVLTRRKQLWGLDHVDTLKSELDLAQCLSSQGRYAEAESHFKTACTRLKRFSDKDNTRVRRAKALWDESVKKSKQRGWPRVKHKLHAAWRRLKLRMFRSTRTDLGTGIPVNSLSSLIRNIAVFTSVLLALVLGIGTFILTSFIINRQPPDLSHVLHAWKQHERKLEENSVLGKEQDEQIMQLRNEIQKLREQRGPVDWSKLDKTI